MLKLPIIHRPVLNWPFEESEEDIFPPIGHFEERTPVRFRGISPKPTFSVIIANEAA